MNIDFQEKMLIVCENNYRKNILKVLSQKHLFLNVKIMSKREFIENLCFKYREDTLYYVTNKYNIKPGIAKKYLDNLYYLNDKESYKSQKLIFLENLKKDLEENNYLIKSKFLYEDYKIYVIGYPYLTSYEEELIKKVGGMIIYPNDLNKSIFAYKFNTLDEEVEYIIKSIAKLISEGIDINKIKICNVSEDYYNSLERVSSFFKIPIKIPSSNTLYNSFIGQSFLKNYSNDLTKTIDLLDKEDENYNKIINICNKYASIIDKTKIKDLIIEDFKNTRIDNYQYKNYIELIDLFSPINDDEYIFLMNFNLSSIPKYLKDEDYITDNVRGELQEKNINTINEEIKNNTIKKIKSINKLVITYKLKSSKEDFYPSSLISELNITESVCENNILNSYSMILDKIEYAKNLDSFYKYGEVNNNLLIYQNSLPNTYNTYNNEYIKIRKDIFQKYFLNGINLSYTQIDKYNKCAFRYYLSYVLGLDKFEDTFETFIGSLFHDVLEKCFHSNLVVKEEVDNYIKEKCINLSKKEEFYINILIKDIEYVVDILNKQKEYTTFTNALYEKKITINLDKEIPFKFTGIIDKILYKEYNDKTLVSLIDYKTGNINIDLNYLPYGLSLQLPIYLYLVKKSNLFPNPTFTGFYLQYILNKDIIRDKDKNINEERENNLKLMGYSLNNMNLLKEFDTTMENSLLIKNMKLSSKGDFYHYAKVLSEDEINKIIDMVSDEIDKVSDKIINGEFPINPKKIGYDKNLGCAYCKFRDICYKKEEDHIILEDIKSLEFLRSEDYAEVD